jgi:hypothetical protein
MKTNLKRNLIQTCLLVAALLALPAVVQAQFTYTIANGAITITGYTGPGGAVNIPDAIDGRPVTAIGNEAFEYCYTLTSVTIGDGVAVIGDSAFWDCYNLTDVTIPDSVTNIGDHAFGDTALTSVTIPNGVTSIGDSTFAGTPLTGVTIPNGVTSIGAFAFAVTALTSVTIPNSVTNIGDEAFWGCSRLTTIVVATNNPAYSSANGVFFNKNETTLVSYPGGLAGQYTIPDSITTIGNSAFEESEGLTSVTIGNSVTAIGDNAFAFCGKLTAITVSAQNPSYSSVNGVLFDKTQTTLIQFPGERGGSYAIPASVTSIGDDAFAGTALTSVPIPNGVTNIGDGAFLNCYNLTDVTIPNSVTTIGSYAFESSGLTNVAFSGLTNVTVGAGVTSIGDGAFSGCYSLTSVTITNSVITIGDQAFANTSLASVTIGGSVTNIGDRAFLDCFDLTDVTIGNSVIRIGSYAFEEDTALTNVTIGNSVADIGDWAFWDCLGLTDVTIPNSVTNIGEAAFWDCKWLANVYFSGNAPTVGLGSFSGDEGDYGETVYYLPGTLGWSSTFAGRPTALWYLPNPLILNQGPGFGVQSNHLGFTVSWATNVSVVVEACTNLSNPVWMPVSTNTLVSGTSYFSDPQRANLPARFYRLRSP